MHPGIGYHHDCGFLPGSSKRDAWRIARQCKTGSNLSHLVCKVITTKGMESNKKFCHGKMMHQKTEAVITGFLWSVPPVNLDAKLLQKIPPSSTKRINPLKV